LPDEVRAVLAAADLAAERTTARVRLAVLRVGEIAKLTWSMVLDADRRIGDRIELWSMPRTGPPRTARGMGGPGGQRPLG
jgi:integrase